MTSDPLFNNIDRRISLSHEESDTTYFLTLSIKLEYVTKLVTAGILACVGDNIDRHRYSTEHRLVRSGSIGDWISALNDLLVGPPAQFLNPYARDIIKDLTERVGPRDWRYTAVSAIREAAESIGAEVQTGAKVSLRQFFEIGAQLRNRSRGHGATTIEQCGNACPSLSHSLEIVIENLSLFEKSWAYLYRNLSGKYRVSPILGDDSSFNYLKVKTDEQLRNGVYLFLEQPVRVNLVFSDPDLRDIALPNGKYSQNTFDVLSYATNNTVREDGSDWIAPPGQLPSSETEGDEVLEPFGNVFANVPPILRDYVPRPELVDSLKNELLQTDRHSIVSLTGPGGIGKTTIAIAALTAISDHESLPYSVIIWISARDIDLLEDGPKPVKPKVINQDDISRAAVELLKPIEIDDKGFKPTSYFERCLKEGTAGNTLFVFDNFETVQSPADVFAWIDTHVRPPNKVLITTRIRDFRGDYPIEIGGMNEDQATLLVDQHAGRLGIRPLITQKYKNDLITESEGHPYVIRIMLGQVAMEGRIVKPERIMASSDNILTALFERTYNALSPGAQKVFLLLSSWRVLVPEVAVEAVLLRPGTTRFSVADAFDQLHRFSLVERTNAVEEDHILVGVPLAAAIYGRLKLEASPFKASVEEDRSYLMEFGPGKASNSQQRILPRIEALYKTVADQAESRPGVFEERKLVLEFLAERVPTAFLKLSDLVLKIDKSKASTEIAKNYLRRYLEMASTPDKREAWLKLADLCLKENDVIGEIHAICEAALLLSLDLETVGDLARHLNNRIRTLKESRNEVIRSAEIKEILGRFIQELEKRLPGLDANTCSQLAWLYANIGDEERALDIAKKGIQREPDNEHCLNIIRKFDS